MLKQLSIKTSKAEMTRLRETIWLTTILTTSWGFLHGFLRQTGEQDWIPVILWGLVGFILGPGLGVSVRFPPDNLRPWPQFCLAVARGLAYGMLIFVTLQFCALYGEWQIIPAEKPSGVDIQFNGMYGFMFLSILLVCVRQLTEYIATIRTTGYGWSRMLAFGLIGLPSGILCWSIYFQIPFRETSAEGIQVFQEILPLLLICSIPMIFIGMALGIVSSAHKISVSELADDTNFILP